MELTGKIVLLTGATGGLGRAIATALAERGAQLILSSRQQQELDQLARSLFGSGHRSIVSDLADVGSARALLAEAGEIDILVSNAALPASGKLDSFTAEQVDRALRVNLEVPVQMTRELIPAFTKRGSGHFVYISSISGKTATARASLYAATKFGLRGFACVCAMICGPPASRLGGKPGRDQRRRDVRRFRSRRTAADRDRQARAGWSRRSQRD
ncbi:SDR family NAD(P)-dependent oxidoreductase, partial [Mycobacterium szulgai]|uniref:SDR family NAD(P)-dependent oxidoreductase n=1 Tax=Mycobacterium szulgai TaxID=1787 RepID=UPI0021F276E6